MVYTVGGGPATANVATFSERAVLRILLVIFGMTWLASNAVCATDAARAEVGNPVAIVIPADPAAPELHAAHEIARYVSLLTGETMPVLREGQDRPKGRALVVGRTTVNLREHDPDQWPRDTIYLGYGDGDIAILGQGPQGTLFAAYAFLRDLGCRWYLPDNVWPEDAFIPRGQKVVFPTTPRKHTPSFMERGWHPHPGAPGTWKAHYVDWAVRNGLNTLKPGALVEYGEARGHGLQLREGHTLYVLMPSGDHPETAATFAAHPEWYPLIGGRRVTQFKDGRPVQACLSKPGVVALTVDKVKAYLREHPDCYRFSVSHCDEPTYWCECQDCLAMDGAGSRWRHNDRYDAYGVKSKSGPGPMSRRWITFVNQVAREVGNQFPDRMISFYAYGSTVAPPPGTDWTLEPNVMIEYAFGDGVCLRHAEDDPDCPPNVAFHGWLSEWAKTGNPILVYDYPPTGGRLNVPAGFIRRYASLVAYTKRLGVCGWAGEAQGSWAASGLWQYVKARLMWDAESDVDALIVEFCRDMYGPAALTMQGWYKAVEDEVMGMPGHTVWGAWAIEIEPNVFVKLDALLRRAEREVDSVTDVGNVAMQRVALNAWVMAWLEAPVNAARSAKLPFSYSEVRRQTQTLVEDHAIPVTDPWRDRLFAGTYEPPIEALGGKVLVDLRDGWRFRTDSENVGGDAGWYRGTEAASSAVWRDIRVDNYWTEQGIDHHGVAWYANTLTIPRHDTSRLWLLFGMIDGDAEVWFDGVSVGDVSGDPWDKPKAFVVPPKHHPGDTVSVVIRVEKTIYAAGIKNGVRLVATEGR